MARSREPSRKQAPWAADRLIVCVGGPLDGHWYRLDEWTERVAAARRAAPHREGTPPTLLYEQSTGVTAHPSEPGARGIAVVWPDPRQTGDPR